MVCYQIELYGIYYIVLDGIVWYGTEQYLLSGKNCIRKSLFLYCNVDEGKPISEQYPAEVCWTEKLTKTLRFEPFRTFSWADKLRSFFRLLRCDCGSNAVVLNTHIGYFQAT